MAPPDKPRESDDVGLIDRYMQLQNHLMSDRLPWEIALDDHYIMLTANRAYVNSGRYGCLGASFVLAVLASGFATSPGASPSSTSWELMVIWSLFLCWSTYIIRWTRTSPRHHCFVPFLIETEDQVIVISPRYRSFTKRVRLDSVESILCSHKHSADFDAHYVCAVMQDGEEIILSGNTSTIAGSDATEYGTRVLGFLCNKPISVRDVDGNQKALTSLFEEEHIHLQNTLIRASHNPGEPTDQLIRPVQEHSQRDPQELLRPPNNT